MEERYKLLLAVLRELSNAEVLDDLILAGSGVNFITGFCLMKPRKFLL
jgi:hypothetical protein